MRARLQHGVVWMLGFAVMLLTGGRARAQSATDAGAPDALQSPELVIDSPDQYAWRLFAEINEPANNGSNDTVWETWINQNDVYTLDPSPTPVWPGTAHRPKELGPSIQHFAAGLPAGGPGQAESGQTGPGLDDVHLNRATFDYVVDHQLWYPDGLKSYIQTTRIQLPRDSITIKAR